MSLYTHLIKVFGVILAVTLLYHGVNIAYNLLGHRLARFPGPLLHRATRLPYTWSILRGSLPHDIAALHRKYGPVVRVAPNELAFADPRAWRDVMGGGRRDLPKWGPAYLIPEFMPPHLQNTTDKEHHRQLRKAVAPGFSDAALRGQEGLIGGYIDLLIHKLREQCEKAQSGEAVVDMETWYRYTVFDIIGDLALGDSFGCLRGAALHPWIKGMSDAGKAMWLLTAASMYPVAKKLSNLAFQTVAARGFEMHNSMVRPLMEKRVRAGTERPDLINPIIMKKEEWNLSPDDMISHATVFIGAGSETTAGVLTGVTSFLLQNPDKMAKLKEEVRTAFKSESDIRYESVSRLPYLVACLDETLRLYPQTGVPSLRITERDDDICGVQVPAGVDCRGCVVWSMNRNPSLFVDPDEFHPERFTGDPRFANDARDTLKPFHVGSRDCIGKGLAIMEMRLILARMMYNFDMTPGVDSRDWTKRQKNLFIVWDKSPMHVSLRPVSQPGPSP